MSTKKYFFALFLFAMAASLATPPGSRTQSPDEPQPGHVRKKGVDLDARSLGRQIADELTESGNVISVDDPGSGRDWTVVPQIKFRGSNVQVNDSSLDNVQTFIARRPFVNFTQSETSVAGAGRNIVATYNSSANQTFSFSPNPPPAGTLIRTSWFISAFSNSNDGGQTWTSGFFPPVPGATFTFGDPSIDVDRDGNFFFATLGVNAPGNGTVQVNKSADGGRTWSDAVVVQQDNGSDKEWLAVGPNPADLTQDYVYVSWTSFQPAPPAGPGGAQLRFGRSTDGGATWTAKTIFIPTADPNPTHPQNFLQYSNVYVDRVSGRLYIPFLHFSNADQDFIRVLISDDAGDTFHFATFNVPGFDPTLLPVTQPGEFTDCRSGGLRLTINAGAPYAGRFGLRSFVQSTRMTLQPAFAARNGILYLAWSNSSSSIFGDPAAGSNIMFIRSDDGGSTWSTPIEVNSGVASDTHHVLPSLSLDAGGVGVHVAFYTQHADGTVDVDMANSLNRGTSFPYNRSIRVTSTPFALAPSNIQLTANTSTNYDRSIQPCYVVGEYLNVKSANGALHLLWGDGRNSVTEPVNSLDPLSGRTHAQTDVFYQKVQAQ
jgi:hypothetical protein